MSASEQWQPIETAPTDGSYCLLFDVYDRDRQIPFVGMFSHLGLGKGHERWLAVPGCYGKKPTHWMPIPAPPIKRT